MSELGIDTESALDHLEEKLEEDTKPKSKVQAEADEVQDSRFSALATLERLGSGRLTKRRQQEYRDRLLSQLAEIPDDDLKEMLADEEVGQAIQRFVTAKTTGAPGSPIFDAKGREIDRVAFTAKDQQEMYEQVKWIPPEDMAGSVNGVDWRVIGGVENITPNVVRDVLMEAWRLRRGAEAEINGFMANLPANGSSREVGWRKPEITANTPGWTER